jgi:hypothetical protein
MEGRKEGGKKGRDDSLKDEGQSEGRSLNLILHEFCVATIHPGTSAMWVSV